MVRWPKLGLVLFIMATACSHTVAVPEKQAVSLDNPEASWNAVLQQFVDENGRVDFSGLAARPDDLHTYVAFIARYSPGSHPQLFSAPADRLAYHINAYNALSMYNVLATGIPESLSGYGKVNFFYFQKLTIGGKKISLYDYENKIIRPMGDERVHFALNCMSVGCPRLPKEPFRAAHLNDQLDRETRRFMAEPRNVQVDHAGKTIRLSEIFRFYKEDFTRANGSLTAYVNRYRSEPVPEGYRVTYIPYDWTVNRQK